MNMKIFKKLGLTKLESKTYSLLIDKEGECRAKDISLSLGIRLEAIYRILNSLVKKGLVVTAGSRPKYYKALPKEIGVKTLLENYQKIAGFITRSKITDNKWPINIILGREQYHAMGDRLFEKAKSEVLVIASGTGNLSSDFTKTMFDATKNSVDYKILATTLDDSNKNLLENWKKNNFKVRFKPGEGINLVIYDREIIQVGLRFKQDSKEKVGILINNKSLASFMAEFYDFLWRKASEI